MVHAFSDASHAPYRFNGRRSITDGAMTDASKRQRSPGGSRFHEHLEEFDEWEEVDLEHANGEVVYMRLC